jgi:integrase
MGVDDMTIQRILRHSNVAVTQTCYIKTLPATVGAAMEKFNDAVGGFVQ